MSEKTTTTVYAQADIHAENGDVTAARGDVVATIEHTVPLEKVLIGLQTERFGTEKPADEPVEDEKPGKKKPAKRADHEAK